MLTLIADKPKKGKSVFAGTFPQPMLYLEFDVNGAESIKNARDKKGELIVKDSSEIHIESFIKSKVYNMDFTTLTQKSNAPAEVEGAVELITKLNKLLKELDENKGYITVDGVKKGPFKTLVIDSLTSMFDLWQDGILAANKKGNMDMADWGTIRRRLFRVFLPAMRTLEQYIPYIIHITHVNSDTDDISGRSTIQPVGPSRPAGQIMGKDYDAIWQLENKSGVYSLRTKVDGGGLKLECGDRYHLPELITPAHFDELSKHLKKDK